MKTIVIFGPNSTAVGKRLIGLHPDVDWRIEEDPVAAIPHLRSAHAIIANGPSINERLMRETARLEWVQAMTTGVDTILGSESLPHDAVVCSTRGIHGPQMSELIFLYMLALSRNFPRMLANQRQCVWEAWPQPVLAGKTVTIVGVGLIAQALAPRCKAFDMNVLGVSATPRDVDGFDRIFSRTALNEALGSADFVVLLVPHNADNHHMIDAAAIDSMKHTAYLLNVARGGVIDEEALIDALLAGRIAGAGLDVFGIEPLPAESPIWRLDNVIVSPRIGGLSTTYVEQIMPIIEHNVSAFLTGRLSNCVNRVR
jgi:D-2-hydroxyacid dehydrogenase (NADP+)